MKNDLKLNHNVNKACPRLSSFVQLGQLIEIYKQFK